MWHAKTWAALVVVAVAVAATAGIGWANRPEPPAPEPAATPAADAAGPAIPAKQPAAAANQRTSIRFTGPVGMKVTWQLPGGGFNDEASGLTAPTEHNFLQGQVYRLRLTQIPNFPGKTCYPTLEVSPATPKTTTFLAHASVPVTFNEEDFEQAVEGNLVVKVVYLPDPTFRDLSNVGGTEEIVSTRLEPGTDPVAEAQRRGTVLAIIRLGNIDLENKGTAPLPPNLERDGPAEPRVQKEYWGEPVAFGRLGKEWSYFLAISPDGKRMLVHHHQEMFCVDLASASLVWRVRVGGLHNAAFTPDGKRIATAEWQDGANIYDAATGKLLDSFIVGGPNGERPGRVGFLPDGKLVVHTSSWSYTEDKTRPRADGSPTVTQTLNYSLIVWDPATRKEVRRTSETLKYEGSHIWQLLVGRGQMMQLQQFEENGRSVKKTISFTDPATGKATPALTIHKDDDHRFDLSPDGQTLLLRTAGQPPRLLDVTTGKVRATLDGHKRLVTGGAFSPDGKLVATVSGSDIDGYERAKLLPGGPPDGPAELVIWDAQAGQPLVRYTYPTGQYDFTRVGFSPDGQYLYAMTTEKRIVVWGQLPFRRPAPDEAVGIPRLADPAPKQPDPVRPFAGGQPAQPPAPAGIVADALDKLIESLPKSGRTAGQQVDALFLATLGRLPTATELKRIGDKYGATLKVENLRAIVIELTASPEFEAHVKTLQKRLGVPAIPQPFVPMFGPPKLDPEPGTDPTKKQ